MTCVTPACGSGCACVTRLDPAQRERHHGRGQREQQRDQREPGGRGAQQVPAEAAQRFGRARAAAGPGAPRRCPPRPAPGFRTGPVPAEASTTRAVASGLASRPAVAASSACSSASRATCIRRVPHQRDEREHLPPDPRHGHQPVVVAGQVRPLVRQHRSDLLVVQRLQRARGHDHRRVRARHAVDGRLRVLDQHGPQVRLRPPDQADGLRVSAPPARGPPGGAWPRSTAVQAATAAARTRPRPATAPPPGVA